jgi:predicted amidohydrolase
MSVFVPAAPPEECGKSWFVSKIEATARYCLMLVASSAQLGLLKHLITKSGGQWM